MKIDQISPNRPRWIFIASILMEVSSQEGHNRYIVDAYGTYMIIHISILFLIMDLFSLIYLVIWLLCYLFNLYILDTVVLYDFNCKYINSKKSPLSVPTSYTMITIFRRTNMEPAVASGFRSNIICFLSSLDITFRRCGFGFGLEIPLGFPKGF